MKRKVTQAMADAAITAGANPDNLEIVSQAEYDALQQKAETEKTPLEALTEKLEQASDEDKPGIQAEIDALTTTEEGGDHSSTAEIDAQISALQGELAGAMAQVEVLTAELNETKALLAAADASPLRKFAEERMATMRIALNLTSVDFTDFGTEAFIVEYEAIDKLFKKNFSAGGHKPKVKDDSAPQVKKSNITSLEQARFTAVGL